MEMMKNLIEDHAEGKLMVRYLQFGKKRKSIQKGRSEPREDWEVNSTLQCFQYWHLGPEQWPIRKGDINKQFIHLENFLYNVFLAVWLQEL